MARLIRLAIGLGQLAVACALIGAPIAIGFWAREGAVDDPEARYESEGRVVTRHATMVSDADICYQAHAVLGNGQRIVVHSSEQFTRELNGKQVLVSYSGLDDCWELQTTHIQLPRERIGGPRYDGKPHDGQQPTWGRPYDRSNVHVGWPAEGREPRRRAS